MLFQFFLLFNAKHTAKEKHQRLNHCFFFWRSLFLLLQRLAVSDVFAAKKKNSATKKMTTLQIDVKVYYNALSAVECIRKTVLRRLLNHSSTDKSKVSEKIQQVCFRLDCIETVLRRVLLAPTVESLHTLSCQLGKLRRKDVQACVRKTRADSSSDTVKQIKASLDEQYDVLSTLGL